MISGGVNTKRSLESSRRTPARAECTASENTSRGPARRGGRVRLNGRVEEPLGSARSIDARRSARTAPSRTQASEIAIPSHSFSTACALFQTVRMSLKTRDINRLCFHTHAHSFPGSPVVCGFCDFDRGYTYIPRRKKSQKKGGPRVRAASSSVFTLEHAQPVGVGLGVSVTCSVKPTQAKKVARRSACVSMIEFAPSFSGAG
jgi:hypothetical protein